MTVDKDNRVPCTFCNKNVIHNHELKQAGTNVGNSQALARVLMKSYGGGEARSHPLSMPKDEGSCAQAHHLICSESMDDDQWGLICSNFGYNINCKENGIFLPADMRIACQLYIPLHRGNHAATETDENTNYVGAVLNKIRPIKTAAINAEKEYCKPENDIISDLNAVSKEIWGLIKGFTWTLSYDGKDYLGGIKGCLGERSLTKKRESKEIKCDKGRLHAIPILPGTYFLEQ
jgi:hypothetical protein